jgi:hypothetical protein
VLIQNRLEGDVDACPYDELTRQYHCPVDGAPLQPTESFRNPSVPTTAPAYADEPSE